MKYCKKCFKSLCRCNQYKIDLDFYIYPAIYEFNRKGYITTGSCSGHENENTLKTYIEFKKNLTESFTSDYVQIDTYNYNRIRTRDNIIKIKPEIIKTFKKKRTNKLELIQKINYELYRIARELPCIELNPDIEEKTFSDNYFFDQFYTPDIPDIQKPWTIIIPNSANCKKYVDDYFNVVYEWKNLYKAVLNNTTSDIPLRLSTFDYRDSGYELRKFFKDQLIFDTSLNPRLILFGQEKNMQIESECFHGCKWTLSYVILTPENEYYLTTEDVSSFNIMPDIQDYVDEHKKDDILDALEYGFSLLINRNINICAFSSENILIIFSNKIDFAYHSSTDGIAAIFGKVDYDDAEYFNHVYVKNKEAYVIINDGILLRKEIVDDAG